MTQVYLMINAEVYNKDNLINIHNGDLKSEAAFLSVSGEKKAEEVSKNKKLQGIDAVYSSTYIRALETAKYMALENNTIIHVDDRYNERLIGDISPMELNEFRVLQAKDFDFKLSSCESINETKKRMQLALKDVLSNEVGNTVVIISHPIAITALLSTWCEVGYNLDKDIILTYEGKNIVSGTYSFEVVFKLDFDGTNLLDVNRIEL